MLPKNKEKLQKEAHERCQNFTEEEKESVKIIVNVTKNLSEDQKQNLVEHTRNYYIIHKR